MKPLARLAVVLLLAAGLWPAVPCLAGPASPPDLEQGVRLFREGRLDEAAPIFEAILASSGGSGDREGLASKYLGNILVVRGDLAGARGRYEQALATFRRTGNQAEISNTLSNMATLEDRLHRYTEALRLYREVLRFDEASNDAFAQALTLRSIGSVQRRLGQHAEALASLGRAREMLTGLKGTPAAATAAALCLVEMGNVAADEGRAVEAERAYREALSLFEKASFPSGRARSLYEIARLQWKQGRLGEARLSALAALQAAGETRQPAPRGEIAQLLGAISEDLGQHGDALSFYEKAVLYSAQDRQGLATALECVGNVHMRFGRLAQALEAYAQALEIFVSVNDRRGAGSARNGLGIVAVRQERLGEAATLLRQAAVDAAEVRDVPGQVRALGNLAYVLYRGGQEAEALARSSDAVALFGGGAVDPGARLPVLALRGMLLARQGQAAALDMYRQAIALLEETRAGLQQQKLKATFLEDKAQVYELAVSLLVGLGRDADVFEYLERARSRAFLDMMGNQRLRTREGVAVQVLVERELALQEAIARASREDEMRKAVAEHQEVLKRLRKLDPDYASARGIDPVSLRDLQKGLDERTALVEYFVGRDESLACVVTRGGVRVVKLPRTPAQIVERVKGARRFIADKGDKANPDWQVHLADLYQALWVPVEPLLGGRRRVCIVPHGWLHYLPFGALVVQKDTNGDHVIPSPRFLVDDYTLLYSPSATVYHHARRKGGGRYVNALVLGNALTEMPPLESAEAEAKAIAGIVPSSTVYLRDRATEAAVKKEAAGFDIIHLATHGELKPDRPMESRILLTRGGGEDGHLTVSEIFGMRLKASLVVLSACETGEVASLSMLHDFPPGDDLVGLTRSFLYAGAPSVVASLWPVDDKATAILMTTMYRRLIGKEGGGTPGDRAESLRQGQLAILAMGRKGDNILYTHPNLWAPFVLVGGDDR